MARHRVKKHHKGGKKLKIHGGFKSMHHKRGRHKRA
jgi:hypothetical protein